MFYIKVLLSLNFAPFDCGFKFMNWLNILLLSILTRVEAKIDKFTMLGTQQDDFIPRMVSSPATQTDSVMSLLDVLFETNPLDGLADTRIRANARPLQVIYDAVGL